MQLAKTYLEAGKRTEAQQAFNRLVEEFPDSPFSGDAARIGFIKENLNELRT